MPDGGFGLALLGTDNPSATIPRMLLAYRPQQMMDVYEKKILPRRSDYEGVHL
jgi:hypothetical protein